jgi:hypothetical protein
MRISTLSKYAIGVTIALTVVVVGGGAAASAAESDDFDTIQHGPDNPDAFTTIEDGPSEATLTFSPGTDGSAARIADVQFSPAGCTGQTDWAHPSGNEASVHARTTCSVRVPSLGVSTNLQKQGWFYWENIKWDESSRADASNSEDAHPHWDCSGWGSQNYRGVSSHWSDEPSGYYTATTVGGEQRFGC